MKVDWSTLSNDVTPEEAATAFEPVGRFIIYHTQFDLTLGRIIAQIAGLGEINAAIRIIQTLDAANKRKILDSAASVYASDPNNMVPDYKPNPEIRKRLKKLTKSFDEASKVRNILAHGTVARLGNRIFIGTMDAAAYLKNTGGSDNWIFIDTIVNHANDMVAAINDGNALQREFIEIANARKLNESGAQ